MLLVVRAKPTIIGAAPLDGCVVDHGLFGRFDKHFARAAIVVDVVGNEHARVAMLRTAFQHPHFAIFEDNLRVDTAVASGADGDSHVIEEVGAKFLSHCSLREAVKVAAGCGGGRSGLA